MIKEGKEFFKEIVCQKSIWTDAELWISIFLAAGLGIWYAHDYSVLFTVKNRSTEVLALASLAFGFASASLVYYSQAAADWSDEPKVSSVAKKIVSWHIWTILTLLSFIVLGTTLLVFGSQLASLRWVEVPLYAVNAFLGLYGLLQVVNHVLTVGWVFKRRADLKGKNANISVGNDDKFRQPRDAESKDNE